MIIALFARARVRVLTGATSAGNLEWFVNQFFQIEKQLAKDQGKSVYDICNELVASTNPKDSIGCHVLACIIRTFPQFFVIPEH